MGRTRETSKLLSTAEVADSIGVHKDTILRWLRSGLIPEPKRDRRGWRVFGEDDLKAIRHFSESGYNSVAHEATATYTVSPSLAPLPLLSALEEIDWDFPDAMTTYLTHGMHPYPAKFIPQIPNALIQELSSVGDTVMDIFCGSGTTLVEALTLKRHAIGIDANPLACLISNAKTTRLVDGDEERLYSLVNKATSLAGTISGYGKNTLFGDTAFISSGWRPRSDNVKFWFDDFVVEELAEILAWCRALPSHSAQTIALTSLSAIIVTVSKQDSDTRYVRRQKNIAAGDTLRRFSRVLADNVHTASEFTELVEPRFTCRVMYNSILSRPPVGTVDLVVCSPPYPNAYSYHLYHMTRMLWLGMNQSKFKIEEIGSHRKYSNKGRNKATVDTFKAEMDSIFQWLTQHLKPGGYACFVIGDSTLDGERIDNAELVSSVAQKRDFTEACCLHRRMQATKKAFNPVIGKIKDERILVLQKDR